MLLLLSTGDREGCRDGDTTAAVAAVMYTQYNIHILCVSLWYVYVRRMESMKYVLYVHMNRGEDEPVQAVRRATSHLGENTYEQPAEAC